MSDETMTEVRLAAWTTRLERSVLREMITVVSQPGILSFAGGLPAPELFPRTEYASALAEVMALDGAKALQYGPTVAKLREQIVALMALRGIRDVRPEQVFITTGAQQAINIVANLLLDPGGQVLLERNTYTGAQQVIQPRMGEALLVDTDLESGLDVAQVEDYLKGGARPAFLYAIPEAHNPLGVSLSVEKRGYLARLAADYNLPIIEDDPYGLLYYGEGEAPVALRAHNAGQVFYAGSFSKIIAPALRLGWMVAPEALLPKIMVIKEMFDLESSQLTQRAVSAFLASGQFEPHLQRLRAAYRDRRDAMLAGLRAHFPAEAVWTEPQAGMFIWVELPRTVDTAELLKVAVAEEKVAFIPGHAFSVSAPGAGPKATNCMRLNFTNVDSARIADGMARLGRVVKAALA